MARILVTLVFCFLFCNLGKIVLSIYDLGNSGKVIQNIIICFIQRCKKCCNLLFIFLSYCNFLIFHVEQIRNCLDLNLQLRIPSWVIAMTSFTHLFLVMNASANLILISATGTQFRDTLLAMLRLRKPRNTSSSTNNTW